HARQVQVQHDGVEVVDHGQVQAGHAVGGEVHGMAAVFEVVAQVGGDIAVVFDDEDAHVLLRPCGPFVWLARAPRGRRVARAVTPGTSGVVATDDAGVRVAEANRHAAHPTAAIRAQKGPSGVTAWAKVLPRLPYLLHIRWREGRRLTMELRSGGD